MEDDYGNLLVLDHPFANEFYEYALKQRIFENLLMAGESTVSNYLQIIEQRLRSARNNALSYINTPDFKEMEKNWDMNRKAMYHRYYNMFKSTI
jgi:cyclopropane fatty-acyl-phospholipid synthase-like methyltransferase